MLYGEFMLKGTNRNVIVVRADKRSSFDTVYFVLKKGKVREGSDIIREANRIVHENDSSVYHSTSRFGKGRLLFLGVLVGAVAASCLWGLIISFTL